MADTADLKSAAVRHEGSNPSAPTKKGLDMNAWEFVDAMLAEAETEEKNCTFQRAQVSKLREMIAEIPAQSSGRTRARLGRDGIKYTTHTIRIPQDVYNTINKQAEEQDTSFNKVVVEILQDYMDNGGAAK